MLGAGQFFIRHAIFGNVPDRALEDVLQPCQRAIAARRAIDDETGRIERGVKVIGADADRDLLLQHRFLVQAAGRAAGEDLGQQFQGFRLPVLAGCLARHQPAFGNGRLADALILQMHAALAAERRLCRADTRTRLGPARQLAIGFFGKLAHIGRFHIAGHHQNGIVGRVEAVIEGDDGVVVQRLDFALPADHR